MKERGLPFLFSFSERTGGKINRECRRVETSLIYKKMKCHDFNWSRGGEEGGERILIRSGSTNALQVEKKMLSTTKTYPCAKKTTTAVLMCRRKRKKKKKQRSKPGTAINFVWKGRCNSSSDVSGSQSHGRRYASVQACFGFVFSFFFFFFFTLTLNPPSLYKNPYFNWTGLKNRRHPELTRAR